MTFIFPRNWISGLTLSTAGSSATFNVAIGQATDSTNVAIMNLPVSLAKTTAAWVSGNGGAFLDVGSVAINTWYHIFLIDDVGDGILATDVGFSTSLTPTLPTGYTIYRRIGSMLTDGSSNWTAFIQIGDDFRWVTTRLDVNGATILTTATLYTLPSVPLGLVVKAYLSAYTIDVTANGIAYCYFSSPDQTDEGWIGVTSPVTMLSYTPNQTDVEIGIEIFKYINTSQQIRGRTANVSGCTIYLRVFGWIDTRGRI